MDQATERERLISPVLLNLVLYASQLVGAGGRGGIVCLVWLRVHEAIGSSSSSLSMSELLIRSVMLVCTLVDGVTVTVTLIDGVISTCVHGGGGVSVTDTLGDERAFTCNSFCVKNMGLFCGGFFVGSWYMVLD